MKTINAMSKTHFYRTIEYTNVHTVVIDTETFEVDKEYIVTLNCDARSACKILDAEHKSFEQIDSELKAWCKERVKACLPDNKQIVAVNSFRCGKSAFAMPYSDLIKYGVELVQGDDGTWYYPDC